MSWAQFLDPNEFSWALFLQPDTLRMYAWGMWTTFYMLIGLLCFGGIAGFVLALMLTGRSVVLQRIASAFTYCVRGTPLLIQLYLIYYGVAQLEWVQERWDAVWPWTYFKTPLFCAMLAFSINHAGYLAEILAGGIRATPAGEIEAGYAMGMSRLKVWYRIILPGAMRRILPPYSNEVMQMMHGTSLASTIPSLMDITGVSSRIYSDYYLPFEAYLFAAILYLLITFFLMSLFRLAERRFTAYLRPRAH
ncbi:ABC transporter permease [Corticimicrobacter populi]|nr:ABC transporter permease subunit [Corticimicrobacter populi]